MELVDVVEWTMLMVHMNRSDDRTQLDRITAEYDDQVVHAMEENELAL